LPKKLVACSQTYSNHVVGRQGPPDPLQPELAVEISIIPRLAEAKRLISWSSLATRSLDLVAVLVAVEVVGVAAWVSALVVELTCAWRLKGGQPAGSASGAAEFISSLRDENG
jgi:hypothetical protein